MTGMRVGENKFKLMCGDEKVKRVYAGDVKIYSTGNTVTYICDGQTYQEDVDEGQSCLSPDFTPPTKSGYTFAGWSATSDGDVLSDCVMGGSPITLYGIYVITNLTVTDNTKYISTSGNMGAWIWYSTGKSDDTSYINVNYNGYSSVKIAFTITAKNINALKPSTLYINGKKIYDSKAGLAPSKIIASNGVDTTYRYTEIYSGVEKIPVKTHVENYNDANSWADLRASIVSAELSM